MDLRDNDAEPFLDASAKADNGLSEDQRRLRAQLAAAKMKKEREAARAAHMRPIKRNLSIGAAVIGLVIVVGVALSWDTELERRGEAGTDPVADGEVPSDSESVPSAEVAPNPSPDQPPAESSALVETQPAASAQAVRDPPPDDPVPAESEPAPSAAVAPADTTEETAAAATERPAAANGDQDSPEVVAAPPANAETPVEAKPEGLVEETEESAATESETNADGAARDVAALPTSPRTARPARKPAPPGEPDASNLDAPPDAGTLSKAYTSVADPLSGRYLVQLGSVKSPEAARAGWEELRADHAALLGELAPHIESAIVGDKGEYFRLRAGPLMNHNAAKSLCNALWHKNIPCMVVQR